MLLLEGELEVDEWPKIGTGKADFKGIKKVEKEFSYA